MFGTLPSSWSAITRPKTMMVSGRTIRIRPRPNSSGFSAIAPTVAPPTTFSAHAVAIPVPAIVIAAEARETRVGHDVREEARDLDRCDNGFGQPKQTTEDQDERNKGDRLSHETAQVPFEGPRKPAEGNVPDPVSDRAP